MKKFIVRYYLVSDFDRDIVNVVKRELLASDVSDALDKGDPGNFKDERDWTSMLNWTAEEV